MSRQKQNLLIGIISFAMLLGLGTERAIAQQQSQSNVAINVSATVTSSVEMITLQSMRLSGEDAQNNIIRIDPSTSPNAGKMVAYGNPNSDIRISYLPTRELTHVDGTGTLTFNYRLVGNQLEDQVSAEILNVENRDFSFNTDGEFYIWIGGNVNISTAAPGSYQGEFTVEIEYI